MTLPVTYINMASYVCLYSELHPTNHTIMEYQELACDINFLQHEPPCNQSKHIIYYVYYFSTTLREICYTFSKFK